MLPSPLLNPLEARVLGCLIEKEMATPEYYPLTLGALTAACNQKSNRDPVMSVEEAAVEAALDTLRRESKLAMLIREAGARVPKYRHELSSRYAVNATEKAVLAELLLRGPQTIAELRLHTARLLGTVETAAIEEALAALEDLGGVNLVVKLPRAHGARENRYAHQFCGEPRVGGEAPRVIELPPPPEAARLEEMEAEVARLRAELTALREAFEAFKSSFA